MRLLLVLAAAAPSSLAAAQTYTIIEIGPQFNGSGAFALSNAGRAVGHALNPSPSPHHGMIWENGQVTIVSPLPAGADGAICWGVSESGEVTGDLRNGGAILGAFRRSAAGSITLLPGFVGGTAPGQRRGEDINDLGQIVGYGALPANGQQRGALWQADNTITNLGDLPGAWDGAAYSINNDGVVAGYSSALEHVRYRGCRYDAANGLLDLGTLGGFSSDAAAVNEAGVIVGTSHTGPTSATDNYPRFHAFRWSEGVMTDLGVYPGDNHSHGLAINNQGDIVGAGKISIFSTFVRALLWRNGQVIDLNTRIPAGSGWHLRHAYAINDSGWITCDGSYLGGGSRAVLLVPMP